MLDAFLDDTFRRREERRLELVGRHDVLDALGLHQRLQELSQDLPVAVGAVRGEPDALEFRRHLFVHQRFDLTGDLRADRAGEELHVPLLVCKFSMLLCDMVDDLTEVAEAFVVGELFQIYDRLRLQSEADLSQLFHRPPSLSIFDVPLQLFESTLILQVFEFVVHVPSNPVQRFVEYLLLVECTSDQMFWGSIFLNYRLFF